MNLNEHFFKGAKMLNETLMDKNISVVTEEHEVKSRGETNINVLFQNLDISRLWCREQNHCNSNQIDLYWL